MRWLDNNSYCCRYINTDIIDILHSRVLEMFHRLLLFCLNGNGQQLEEQAFHHPELQDIPNYNTIVYINEYVRK